ncbi:MAG: hypothetical protein E2586_03685 [Novosphingobium sp.]|uniref:hypothetical protein n=1 Tax=Novosphingobium sp. TaxID=1874826 RepID=UPI0012D11475|nr:hypothetical protein [Novosphingobium sp.]MPS67579.1 hypothetical protein [Novosphingobium sp.]
MIALTHKAPKGAALIAFLLAVLLPGPASAQASMAAPAEGRGERVATALAAAQDAQGRADQNALSDALRIIDRSGARPLEDWNGPDPVPAWRALLPDRAAVPLRGSPLGPGYRSGQVRPGKSESFQQVFLSGRKASIALSSPGGAPLSLRVVDADRKQVCVSETARQACRWVPIFTQRYVIEVRNSGESQASYFLVVE